MDRFLETSVTSLPVLFFGQLAEQFGRVREVEIPTGGCTVAELRERLIASDEHLAKLRASPFGHPCRDRPSRSSARRPGLRRGRRSPSSHRCRADERPPHRSGDRAGPRAGRFHGRPGRRGRRGHFLSAWPGRRPRRKSGAVEHLFLDHYPGMTERSLAAIAADGQARFDVSCHLRWCIVAARSRRASRSCSPPPPPRTAGPRSRPPII